VGGRLVRAGKVCYDVGKRKFTGKGADMKEYIGTVCLDLTHWQEAEEEQDDFTIKELLEIVKTVDRADYGRVIEEKGSWPILYHLSEQRQNIVEGIPIRDTDHVLEIGAACGAVTGMLSKKSGRVTCVEPSKTKCEVNAYRNRNLGNIEIKAGDYQTVLPYLKEKYDLVTLIDVLEHAPDYTDSPEPFLDFLKLVTGLLREDGRLVVAIENKYGLKYWAGCKEEHVHSFFAGMEGYPENSRVKTFAKGRLEELLRLAGFQDVTFYYPYPDHKFAMQIYSDDYLPKKGELIHNTRNYDDDRMYLFHEDAVYDNLIEDKMFPYFSNSYLIVAKRKG